MITLEDLLYYELVDHGTDSDGVDYLVFQKGRRRVNVWVLKDPEGNGPGFLDIVGETDG